MHENTLEGEWFSRCLTISTILTNAFANDDGTPTTGKSTLIKLFKTKLIGKALEIFPDTPADAFRSKIKPDNSKIIAGRMASRVDKQSMQNFAKSADELSEALRRAYITYNRENIIEMATDKTVEMCRINAKT